MTDAATPRADEASVDDVYDAGDLRDPLRLRAALEAILFVVDAPVDVATLAAAVSRPSSEVLAALADLAALLDETTSGMVLREVAGGYRLYTRPVFAPWVERFLVDGQRSRLSHAALETLAIVAYRQPVTRGRVAAIRGVNVDGVMRTLLSRGLVAEAGADPDTGGGLYRTTAVFLETMGLHDLTELPSLAPLLPSLVDVDSDQA